MYDQKITKAYDDTLKLKKWLYHFLIYMLCTIKRIINI